MTLGDLRLGLIDKIEQLSVAELPREIGPEPLVARVLPRLAVEERIPPRAAERRKRGLDGGFDHPLAHRLARADALARARTRG